MAGPPVLEALKAPALREKIDKNGAKATIVNLWATWCEPCKDEMPELLALQKRFASAGAQMILISADGPDDQKQAASFLEKVGIDFAVYKLDQDPQAFMKSFVENWTATLPTTLLFDQKGRRLGYWVGRVKLKELEARLSRALPRLDSPSKIGSDQKRKRSEK